MKVVSYSRWSLNAGSIRLIEEGVVVSEQWSLKADGLLIQVVSYTGLTVFSFTNKSLVLTHYYLISSFNPYPHKRPFESAVGKGENAG